MGLSSYSVGLFFSCVSVAKISLCSVRDVLGRWTLLDLEVKVIKWILRGFFLFLSSRPRSLFRWGEGRSYFSSLSGTTVCCVVNRMAKKYCLSG